MSLGIILALVAAVFFGISVAMQKYGLKSMSKFSIGGMVKNKKWIASLLIGVVGILLYLIALNQADLSVVQPITALTLVIPVIAGVIFFKEKIRRTEWLMLALVVIGIVLVSAF